MIVCLEAFSLLKNLAMLHPEQRLEDLIQVLARKA
jgi:hypothetical protein